MANEFNATRAELFLKSGRLERAIFLLIFLNALIFSIYIACPVIRDDGWYVLDTFIRKYLDGTLSIADFFTKRGAFDHAMPLQRIIEIIQYKYFSGDYWIMSLVGVCTGGASVAYMLGVIKSSRGENRPTLLTVFAACAISCVYLSINSRWIYDWPLVTIEYAIFLAVLVYFVAIWRAITDGKYVALVLSAIVLGVIADDTSLIAALASIISTVMYAWHGRQWRRAMRVVAAVVVSFTFTNLCYALFFTPAVEIHSTGALVQIWHQLINNGGWWKIFYIPLCSSVVFPEHLDRIFGKSGQVIGWIITVSLITAHFVFWVRAFTRKPSILSQLAVNIMIFFYGLVAGLVYTRVLNFGIDYLLQPRYVLLYQFNLVALLLAIVDTDFIEGQSKSYFVIKTTVAIMCASIVFLQLPLSRISWASVKYVSASYQASVFELGRMYDDPSYLPASCSGITAICNFAPEKRHELLELLKKNRKNIFSENFRSFHRLYLNESDIKS